MSHKGHQSADRNLSRKSERAVSGMVRSKPFQQETQPELMPVPQQLTEKALPHAAAAALSQVFGPAHCARGRCGIASAPRLSSVSCKQTSKALRTCGILYVCATAARRSLKQRACGAHQRKSGLQKGTSRIPTPPSDSLGNSRRSGPILNLWAAPPERDAARRSVPRHCCCGFCAMVPATREAPNCRARACCRIEGLQRWLIAGFAGCAGVALTLQLRQCQHRQLLFAPW